MQLNFMKQQVHHWYCKRYKMYKFGSAIKNDSVGDFFLDEASSSVASEVGVIVGAAIEA